MTYHITEYCKFNTNAWEIADWAYFTDDINDVAEWFASLEASYPIVGEWTEDGFIYNGSLYTISIERN